MTDPMTPPRKFIEQWASEKSYDERDWLYEFHIATRAAQWGADQQLKYVGITEKNILALANELEGADG